MSQRNIHTTSLYNTYNQSSDVQSSRNSTYAPITNHYDEPRPRVAKSVSPADTNPDDIDLNHPANWSIFDDPSQPPRRPKWERKPSAATQSYPVKNYDSSRQSTPTASGAGLPTPHSSYQPTFCQHASSLHGRAPLQSSPYSSTGPFPLPKESYTAHGAPFMAGNAVPVSTQPQIQGFPTPYAGTHTYPPRGSSPTSVPPQGISRLVAPASAQSRPPIPSEWHQSSSQAPHMEAPPAEPRDRERHKPRKPARQSKLDGIPRDRMQRFRIIDMGPGPSSSSGSKRTRSPGSDTLPDAKVRATVQDDANGGSKGKGKAKLSLEEEKLLEKRNKEADRAQAYRNTVDGAYDELRAALYPDEEKHTSVRSEHGKLECMRDAAKVLKDTARREAALHARIKELDESNRSRGAKIASLQATIVIWEQRVGQLLRDERETTGHVTTAGL